MNDRELDLTEAQKAIKSKYPPINKKYECKWNRIQCLFRMSCISSDEHTQTLLKLDLNVLKVCNTHFSHIAVIYIFKKARTLQKRTING